MSNRTHPCTIAECADTAVLVVAPDCGVRDALAMMKEGATGALAICLNNKPLGVLTAHDVPAIALELLENRALTVAEVMPRPLLTVPGEMPCRIARRWMREREVRALMVVDDSGEHAGVVTERELLAHLCDAKARPDQSCSTLDQIFQVLPDTYFRMDREGVILDYRARNNADLYISPEQFLGRRMQDVLPPEAGTRFSEKLALPQGSPELASFEYALPLADGLCYFEARVAALPDGSGEWMAIVRDISERNQLDAALRASESRLKEAQALVHIGSWELDLINDVLWWSDEAYRIFDIDPDKFGASYPAFLKIIHPDDRDAVDRAYTKSVEQHTEYEITHRLLCDDGQIKYLHEQCHTFYDDNGKPLRSIGTTQDISEQESSRRALEASEQRYRGIFEQAAVGVAEIETATGRFLRVNQRYSDIVGYAQEELVGSTFMAITHPDDLQPDLDHMGQLKAGTIHEFSMERRYLCKDGSTVWVELSVSRIGGRNEALNTHIAVVEDITARKHLEALQVGERGILELISRGTASLVEIFNAIILFSEGQHPRLRGAIFQCEGAYLRLVAGPTLSDAYTNMVDGLVEIGSAAGSCGTAVHRRERVIVTDIGKDPLWAAYRTLGEQFEFQACWAEPIIDSRGKVRGVFSLYHPEQRVPAPDEIALIETMAWLAGIAMEREQTGRNLRLAAAVFESTAEGVVITDIDGCIVEVNRAFTEITGYGRDEVLGKNPRLWKSGRHDESFYRDMYRALKDTGRWQGEIWNRRKDGEVFPEWAVISCVLNEQQQPTHYVAVFSDISSIKKTEAELVHLAHYDALTRLPNRLLFNARLEHGLKHAERYKQSLAVIFLDLDRFKNINDSLGHPLGDDLLRQVADLLQGAVRQEDTVARISGDEFVLLMEHIDGPHNAAVLAKKLMLALEESFVLGPQSVRITASMGISIFPRDGKDVAALMRNADAAMYRAKGKGRNTYQFYTEKLTSNAFEQVAMENDLWIAMEQDEFYLLYQPQMDLGNGRIIGVEALIRWNHPTLGIVSPAWFIPVAEECGLIHSIGEWVLNTACAQGRQWLEQGLDFGRIAVNVSGQQLRRGGLVGVVKIALERSGLAAERLELEVTENFIMQGAEQAVAELSALRKLGVTLAIDDFGTGYSSLSYLKKLPIHKLKIDQSFVRDIPQDTNDMAISNAVIALGKNLSLTVIAEGVETEEQAEFFRQADCNEVQGYLYSRPVSAAEVEKLLTK